MDLVIAIYAYDRYMNMRLRRRRLRDTTNPFDVPVDEFRSYYRMPKYLAREIIEEIRPNAADIPQGIPLHLQVLCAFNFYASGSYQRRVGQDAMNFVSQSIVSRCIRNISKIVGNTLKDTYVKFPITVEEKRRKRSRFEEKYGIPGIIGVIDGTHIAIAALKKDEEIPYLNRKGFHSINVQLICDADMKILGVNARYPGSTHDSYIWGCSRVYIHLEQKYIEGDRNNYLLGDSGYPLQPWLLTPISRPTDDIETNYNIRHKKTRCIIENLNGVIKNRFRCLLGESKLRYAPIVVCNIINACVVLNNILHEHNEPLPNNVANEEEEVGGEAINRRTDIDFYTAGVAVRRNLAERIYRQ